MSTVKLKCDTCKREIETLERKEGLNSFNKCIITKGCRGRLYKLARNQYNVREFLPEPQDAGISNFFPRRAFFEYKQELPAEVWTITHNMGIYPSVVVYADNNGNHPITLDRAAYKIKIINDSEIQLIFSSPITGVAHCVARSTKDLEPQILPADDELFQVSTNYVLTFAILGKITRKVINPSDPSSEDSIFTCDPDLDISINISIKEPERDEIFCTENISSHEEFNSPWIDWNALLSRKRRNYCIKSVDIRNFISIQEFYNSIDDIPDGTLFKIKSINFEYDDGNKKNKFTNQDIRSRNVFALLADSPFSNFDKRRDILIDVGEVTSSRVNDSFVFIGGELYLSKSQVENIYPPFEKSNAILAPLSIPTTTPTPTATPTPTPIPIMLL